MTPSNPDNQQPLIYRIADALGITHLVVAVQHSHLMSEIEGLVSALAGKADTNHTHKLIQYNTYASTDGFAGFTVSGTGSFTIGVQDDKSINFQFGPTVKASITNSNVDNLARALRNPDSTPTADSDNLVTSGGVKAAIDDATKAVFGSMPYYITAAHEKMHVHTRILRNNTGATIKLTECIDVTALPAAERANIYWNTPDIDIPNDTEIGIRFVRASNAVFLFYDGNFDY